MMKKRAYIQPVALVVPVAPQRALLQTSNPIPVDPGTEGNQEDADVKGSTFDFEWE